MTLLWPRKLLPPQQPMFHPPPMNVSGPVSASGATDVIAGDAGFWRATFGSVVVTTRDRVKTWNAISARLQGRLYPILVPYCGMYQPFPTEDDERLIFPSSVPHSDGATFSDGSSYFSGTIRAVLAADLAVDAVTGVLTVYTAGIVQAGQVFSFGERMYQLIDAVYTDETTLSVRFQPPLREAVSSGIEANFDRPVCRMRLASDTEMQLTLDMNKRGFPTVNFVEDLVS